MAPFKMSYCQLEVVSDNKYNMYSELHNNKFNSSDSNTVCLEVRVGLEKDFITSLFLSGVYLSSFLLVIISWISFWLDGNRMLERLLLGISLTAILAIYQVGAGKSLK